MTSLKPLAAKLLANMPRAGLYPEIESPLVAPYNVEAEMALFKVWITGMKPRYRFSHRSDDGRTLYWESVSPIPGDSRHEIIHCSADWFWRTR